MKIICDCGAETELIKGDNSFESDNGIYVTENKRDISLWEEHDVVGIVCNKCKESVWLFV